jgi:DNA-binding IclR family transcriptional regulator
MPQRFINRFRRIDDLISRKATGTPAELASKLDIAESTLYEFLNVMKDMGAPIYYNKDRRSYCYEQEGRFTIGFVFEK